MFKTAKILALLLGLALFVGNAFAVDHIVDDNGNPATDYPDLTTALATVGTFAGSDHRIIVREGSYSDAGLVVPGNIIEITGEPGAVFTGDGSADFMDATGAQSGFMVNGLEINGYLDGIFNAGPGTSGHAYSGNLFNGNDRGIVLGTAGGNTVSNNCFVGQITAQGFDNSSGAGTPNVWSGNYFSDLAAIGAYTLAFTVGVGVSDASPQTYDASPSGPSTVEVLDVINVDINWSVPSCDAVDPHLLGGYEFNVTWDITKLSYVGGSAGYDEGLLGSTGDGALYTPIAIDAGAGTATFAAANFTAPGAGDGRMGFLSFEAIGTGASSIGVASDYRDENGDPLVVSSSSLSVTVQDTQAPTITSVVANNPVGDDTYSDGSTAGAGTWGADFASGFVELWINVQAADNFSLDRIQARIDGGGGFNIATGLSGMADGTVDSVYVNITALGEGAHSLEFRARDDALNWSDWGSAYNFNIDKTGPAVSALMLSDLDGCAVDAEYTNETTANVDFTDDGTATEMEFYDGDVPGWQGPIAFANPTTYAFLNTTDGTKSVWIRSYDVYGNMGNQTGPETITLDQVAPVPSGWILAGGAAKTGSTSINGDANEAVAAGAVELAVSEDAGDLVCGGGPWVAAPLHPVPVTLSAGDGMKTVYFAVRDNAGNISTILSDDIELDQTAPDLASFEVIDSNGDECSDSWTVTVVVGYSDADATDVGLAQVSGGPYAYSALDGTSPDTLNFTFTGTIGVDRFCDSINTVYGVLRDDVLNVGAESSDGIVVDCSAPAIASMELSDQATAGTVWSTSATVDVTLSGFDTDIVMVGMGEVSGVYTDTVPFDPNTGVVEFTFAAPTTTDWLYLIGWDCAGRTTGQVADNMKFDLIDPVIDLVEINGGALKTNNPAVSVAVNFTEVNALTIELSENPAVDGSDATYMSYAAGGSPFAFTLSAGDGVKTVYARLTDKSGRTSVIDSDDIELDATAPTGTAVLQADPALQPLALPGYTASLTDNEIVSISADADVVDMAIRNDDGSSNTGWIALASSYTPWTLLAGGDGMRGIEIIFRDDAGNIGSWIPLSIMYDGTAPSPPASATGVPGGSLDMAWDAVADAQFYMLRYNMTNDYPTYTVANPPNPANMGQGFAIPDNPVSATEYMFEGPQPDVYAFSIWSVDSAGNVSASPNTDVYNTNYVPGDFTDGEGGGPDGCIDFADEFGALAIAYNTTMGVDAEYDPYLDIHAFGPNNTPDPDGDIDFDDLIAFALNYDVFRCGSASQQGGGTGIPADKPAVDFIDVVAEVPTFLEAGVEFTVSIKAGYYNEIKGYHIVLDVMPDMVEVVDVNAGSGFEGVEQSFFYSDVDGSTLDLTGVVFGADAALSNEEIASVTFRSRRAGEVLITDQLLDIRDRAGESIEVAFSLNGSVYAGVIPDAYSLHQNYPNPFNPTTTIQLALPQAGEYTLTVFNVLGQVVEEFSGYSDAGHVSIEWNASNMSSGVYFYRAVVGSFTATKKMVLLK